MHHSRLVWTALALWAVAGTTTLALACSDKAKGAQSASATSASCSAAMAAKCTPEQAAACKAHGAGAAMQNCPMKGTSAANAAMCPHGGASATTAVNDHACGMSGATAVTASATGAAGADHCGMKGAASAGSDHCAMKSGASAAAAGAKGACQGQGMTSMAEKSAHGEDCDACADMAKCEQDINAAGGRVQMVPLKNGVMVVYTADSPEGARAVKAAVAHRSERMAVYASAGEKAHLCPECKAMRGAAASGKLTREVVSIEGGCLTLMTSNDPTIIAQLHAMAGTNNNLARAKS